MNDKTSSTDVDDRLERAIAGILAQPIPEFPNPPIPFPDAIAPTVSGKEVRVVGIWRRRWIAVGSVSLVTAVLLVAAIFSAWPKDSWAQVVKAVRKQPWVRMRMWMPDDTAHEKEPGLDIWFSPDKQIVAGRVPGSTLFVELNNQQKQRYDHVTQTIYISDSDQYDEDEFASLSAVVQSFNNQKELKQPAAARATLVSQSKQEGRNGDGSWTDFVFTFEDPRRTPAQYRRIFHVPAGEMLPTRMAEEWTYDGKTNSRVMEMDYPEFGPTDLASLDVPKEAKVVDVHSNSDLKSVLKSYAAQQTAPSEPYSALAIRTVVEKPDWKWINELYKVKSDASGYSIETNDLEELMTLCMSIHEGKTTVPDSPAERLQWWKTESGKLKFTPFGGIAHIQIFVPDRVGYPQLDQPSENVHMTLERHPVVGPGGTVMITITDLKTGKIRTRYWLAADRGFLCVREEYHPASGYLPNNNDWISTRIIDSAEKSPTGRWYATQIRQGVVKRSGDDLQHGQIDGAPSGTSTWRFVVDFDK